MAFDKDKYWKLRKEGKSGQEKPAPVVLPDPSVKVIFDNEGRMVVNNRKYRRQKYSLPTTEVDKATRNRIERKRKRQIAKRRKY